MEEEYVKARPNKVCAVWASYSADSANAANMPRWLAGYLGKVSRLLAEEDEHAVRLFGSSKGPLVLCDLAIEG